MTRILFVDDEPNVLEGLRMSLRRKRAVWNMTFAPSGAAALTEVERESPDVIVTDMRMPHMDGAELLGRVAAMAPHATRIILSGQMDEESTARAVNVAHRFIAKPCDSKTLEAVITRALELRTWLGSDSLGDKLGGLDTLPSLPTAYLALSEAMREPNAPITRVAAIVERDTGMAAKVLKLVNSSFFGMPRNIVSITQAVGYLGLQTMKNLVLLHSVFEQLASSDLAAVERQQSHALLSARIARNLFADKRQSETAETAALLHDIGLLALESRLPKQNAANREEAKLRGVSLETVERQRLSVTHAELGAYLLGLWGLPREIIDAVASHHDPWENVKALDVSVAVRVADGLANELLFDGDGPAPSVPREVLTRLGLTEFAAGTRKLAASLVP